MNAPDETLALLRDSLRRYVEKEIVPRAQAREEQGFVPREVLREMGRLGFFGLRYPEAFGGGALDARATALLAEELGRSTFGGFAITVLVHTDMASPHLVNAGTQAQIAQYLPRIVSGEAISAVAVTEPDAGSDVKAIRTTALLRAPWASASCPASRSAWPRFTPESAAESRLPVERRLSSAAF